MASPTVSLTKCIRLACPFTGTLRAPAYSALTPTLSPAAPPIGFPSDPSTLRLLQDCYENQAEDGRFNLLEDFGIEQKQSEVGKGEKVICHISSFTGKIF